MTSPFEQLLANIDLTPAANVQITGSLEPIASRFAIGQAAATALAAVGSVSNDIWQLRGGTEQQISVEIGGAAASLLSFMCQRLDDNTQPERDPNRPLVGYYQTKDDRWVHLHGGFPNLAEGTLKVLDCALDREAITKAVLNWPGQELEDALAAAGMCGAMARTRQEWHAHPQGIALEQEPAIVIKKIGDAEPLPFAPGERPLSDIKVLDLTRVLAGPTCARTLASHGANVLKINSPELPSIPPFVMDTGHGKRSALLNLKRSEDLRTLQSLISTTDIFSQGYRKGAMERLGLSPEQLAEYRPGIIYVSINAYGHTGPWANRPGWEQLAQTASGVAVDEGSFENPRLIAAAATDYTTGYLAACGALAALTRRAKEGGSYHVQVSLTQTANWLYQFGLKDETREAPGLTPELIAPYLTSSDSGFGKLHHLDPILRMSETQPHWSQVTVPLGTHAANW